MEGDTPDPYRDHVSLAFLGLATGIAAGVALLSGALWLVRTLQVGASPSSTPDLGSPAAFVFLTGSLGGVLLAALVTWRLLAPIGSPYRQGGLAMVAAFATILVVTVVTGPVDRWLGRWGILGIAMVAAAAGWQLARGAVRVGGRR